MTGSTLSPLQATLLVARREIVTRVRTRAYVITTAVLVVAVVAGIVVAQAAQGGARIYQVGAVDDAGAGVEQVAAASGVDVDLTSVPSRSAGEAAVTDGSLDALLVPASGSSTGAVDVVVHTTLDPALSTLFDSLARQAVLTDEVTGLGGDPAAVAQEVGSAHAHVVTLEPPRERDVAQVIAAYLIGILLFMSMMICSQLVAQGVVEEKTSRVVELLLAAVRPSHLMAGKVLGIGAVGLIQVGITAGAAVVAATATGLLSTSSLAVGPTLVWSLLWFLVGFLTFALILAALAALVSRQEEVSSVTTPATMLMVLPYVFGISVLPWDPDNALARTLSFIPFFSPLLMPMRAALGSASTWEVVIALVLALAVLPGLVWLAGRIYSNAVLRTGARVKLRDAFRAA